MPTLMPQRSIAFSIRSTARAAAVAIGLAAACSWAVAGCGTYTPDTVAPGAAPSPGRMEPARDGGFIDAVYRPGSASMIKVLDPVLPPGTIVGTWRFTFTSDGTAYPAPIPMGAVVDFGTQQWHADQTEFMISGARAPSTGDVCMGMWQSLGNGSYRLKHIALAWVSGDTTAPGPVTPAAYLGPAIITETIKLDSRLGNHFTGTFTLDQYAKDETTLLQHIAGSVVGTRFTVD